MGTKLHKKVETPNYSLEFPPYSYYYLKKSATL